MGDATQPCNCTTGCRCRTDNHRGEPVTSLTLAGETYCCRRQYARAWRYRDAAACATRRPGTGNCVKCGGNEFGVYQRTGLRYCKPCGRARKRKRRAENPMVTKDDALKTTYGITYDQYNEILMAQCGACAVCGNLEPSIDGRTGRSRRLGVHHDHDTGAVVALLCLPCNRGIGLLKDDSDLLMRAAMLQLGR